jgi:hypothetical protein
MTARYQHAIVACARWETEYLTEWLLYHRQIGFDHVYLYCNDDDPSECYERLLPFLGGPAPFVSFVHFRFVGLQKQMYKHFLKHRLHEVEWFIFLDIDEFLVFREDGTVGNFLAKRQADADMIFFNWLIFGHSGFKERPKGSVLKNYTMRAAELNSYTKVITRAAALDAAHYIANGESGFWHSWNFRGEPLNRAVNVIGEDMTGYFAKEPGAVRDFFKAENREQRIIATAVIHHYQFRSEDEIARRLQRGTAGEFQYTLVFKQVVDEGYLDAFLARFSEVEDTSLRDYWRYVCDLAHDTTLVPRAPFTNIALDKPATQSSISPWSRGATPEEDAAGAVSGNFSGSYNCHTGEEDGPWWRVDLLNVFEIRQIRIFNRTDLDLFRQRASLFVLETSIDGLDWVILHKTTAPLSFGGTDGQPLIWSNQSPRLARHVRFRLLTRTLLHLEAIEIYEHPYQVHRVEPAQYGPLTERIVRGSLNTA